jgi:hypothetical protein
MSTSRGTIIAICSTLLAFLVLGVSGSVKPTPVSASNEVKSKAASVLSPDKAAAFQQALDDSLRESAASTLDAIAAQDAVLARIDANIEEIAQREAAVEAAAQAAADEKAEAEEIAAKALSDKEAAAKKATEEAAVKAAESPSPIRRSSTIWNVEGNWNYTTEQLAVHLQDVHGLNVDGYGREDMKTMHDNLHNGYSAMGGTVTGGNDRGTRSAVRTKPTYQRQSSNKGVVGAVIAAPFELLFGRRNSNSTYCPPTRRGG